MTMAVYVDYLFYSEQFLGTAIEQTDFNRLARVASAKIDQLTFGRAAPIIEADDDEDLIAKIQMATCAVAEELQSQAAGAEIQSERVGNYSVSYANAQPVVSKVARLSEAAKLYLWDTELMLRGFLEDEYGDNSLS
jgi:hypothetical protein